MLNASYNLPSEDSNTEKQMVFHSNKLLCVYSLQSWLSDTFTFGSEPPCCWQARGDAAALGRASRAGGDPARPPGVQLAVQIGTWEVPLPQPVPALWAQPGSQARGSGLSWEANPPRSWRQLWGGARCPAAGGMRMPPARQTLQPGSRQ